MTYQTEPIHVRFSRASRSIFETFKAPELTVYAKKVFKTLFGSICRKMEPIEKNTSDNDNEDVNANW